MNPFSEKDPIGALGEKPLIFRICRMLGSAMPQPPFGAGDDCAVLPQVGGKMLATADSLIYGRHFDDSAPAELVGRKLLSRNVSDIASMGGDPLYAITSAIMSPNVSAGWLDGFCRGLAEAADGFGIKVVGGDVASVGGTFFAMNLTLFGRAPERPLLRSSAEVGDVVYTTGRLGLSFESGRHLTFVPRLEQGKYLASLSGVGACTDLSDGLAADIENIIPENACAEIDPQSVPRTQFCGRTATLEQALCGGEDYELLFTFRGDCAAFERAWLECFGESVFGIGEIRAARSDAECGKLVVVDPQSGVRGIFGTGGFDHFAQA